MHNTENDLEMHNSSAPLLHESKLAVQAHGAAVSFQFEGVEFSQFAVPWNLNVLLYQGGAAVNARVVQKLIAEGALGPPLLDERLSLVTALHGELAARLASGASKQTVKAVIRNLGTMFQFADAQGLEMSMESVTASYCFWAASLVDRTRLPKRTDGRSTKVKNGPLLRTSAYTLGISVGDLLNKILRRTTHILELTALEPPETRKSPIGVQAEKQNLADTFAFGHLITDICDALQIQTVKTAPLPLSIALRAGQRIEVKESPSHPLMDDATQLGKRYILANIRIQAELCMFIAQTSMNVTDAHSCQLRRFFYSGHIDGYEVRDHKNRRNGLVLFEIFKEYKPHFERYLEWRRTFFPNSNLLFPLIHRRGSLPSTPFNPGALMRLCKQAEVPYIPSLRLRGTRVNWLLRKSSDPDVTAEMVQHLKKTLLNVYHRPSYQRAMGEAIRFWEKIDPHLARPEAVAPGSCDGVSPTQTSDAPSGAPTPDCRRPSGCLWCLHHRDIDSLDYVWALVTFKHLKIIELGRGRIPKPDDEAPPAKLVIDRINEKLSSLRESNEQRSGWVVEAETRIEEEDFHPSFKDEIQELEDEA